jgi:rhodanese-related sulfurtransferase
VPVHVRVRLRSLPLWCGAALLAAACGCSTQTDTPPATVKMQDTVPEFPRRMPAEVVHAYLARHPEALLLDVRSPQEWNDDVGHIDGSKQIPLKELGGRIDELDPWRDKPVIVVSRIGDRGGAAVVVLREAGFAQVSTIEGGLEAWRRAGY